MTTDDQAVVPPLASQPGTPPSMRGVLDLRPTGDDVWRTTARTATSNGRMFGGEVAAQALMAAQATVPGDRHVHSLHGYFVLPGDPGLPTDHHVARVRDGGSYTTRSVSSVQGDADVFTLTASFQRPEEPAVSHQFATLEVAPPDASATAAQVLASAPEAIGRWLSRVAEHFPWEFRFPPDALDGGDPEEATDRSADGPRPAVPSRTWFRLRGDLPRDHPHEHAAAVTYLSDMFLLGSALRPHGILFGRPGLFVTSLDHNVWFHAAPRVDDWLLYDTRSVWADGGRALCRGRLWTPEGRLVATVAQEGVVRIR